MFGTIYKGIGGFYYVKCDDKVFETRACGRLRKEKIVPMIGDRVELSENCDSILNILPRKSSFIRPPVANIDQMVIVASVVSPQIDLNLIDTLILQNELSGIETIICINKAELADEEQIEKIIKTYETAGYTALAVSAKEKIGTERLYSLLKGKITAFAGNSGVGKSSILNLLGGNLALETGSISRIERGRHTTRHVELLPLEGHGFAIDTPGFSRIELPPMCAENIAQYFKEFEEYEPRCRFRGCTHINEPDCAVRAAAQNGDIGLSRYESYKSFCEKLKDVRKWQL